MNGVEIAARGTERMRLLSWPRPYSANPYLSQLANALADEGVTTRSHRYLVPLLASPRESRWVHLHWPEWMTRDAVRLRSRSRHAWLLGWIDHARARGVRVAWTAHNLIGHDDPHPDLAKWGRREFLSRCDVVFGHFASTEKDVRDLGFRGRFALTPHPGSIVAQPSPTRERARDQLGYSRDVRLLLAFGSIEPYKGFDTLASAFVRRAPSNARLHIAGSPNSLSALNAIYVSSARDPRVRVEPRFVDDVQTSLLMRAADAVIFSYRQFYTSGAAMLALSHGAPLIGPPIHHLGEMIGQPFFVPLADLENIDVAIRSLDGLRADVSQIAESYAENRTFRQMAITIRTTLAEQGGVR